jgi:RNA polymerase sigma factor (sigma-70 family)
MTDNFTVFIVDDDPSIRDALSLLLAVHDYRVAVFASAESFLDKLSPSWRGCLLLDIRMPGMDGLELQQVLQVGGVSLPVIIMTGHGDTTSAREAFRAQAVDFLEKPLDQDSLLNALQEARSRCEATMSQEGRRQEANELVRALTSREREVLDLVIAGRHNREIAVNLGISPRTVEVHKMRLMDKLRVRNVAELVRLSLMLNDK